MIVLLLVTGLLFVAGAVLTAAMMRRDSPALGLAGLGLMITGGISGAVYGVLASV